MNDFNKTIDEAYELFNQKEFDAALKLVTDAQISIAHNGEISDEVKTSLYNFKGFIFLGLDDLENTRRCFEKALEVNPNSSQACAGLGEVFFIQRLDQEAKVMFEWALDNNPQNQFAIGGLAKVNTSLGLPESHNTLNIETTLKKRSVYYRLLAEAYQLFAEKKHEETLKKLNEVDKLFCKTLGSKEITTRIASLDNFKGFNYLALGMLEEAQESFEQALNLNSNSSQACAGLGEVFYLIGRDEDAKSMFEWGVKNNPLNKVAIAGLEKVNKTLGLIDSDNSLLKKQSA
jgi:tetratricopeptide (TPR) repeat protein